MDFIKKHRYTLLIILIFILLVFLGVKLKGVLMPDDNKELYGNRLDDLPNHKIDDDLFVKIKSEMEGKKTVTSLSYRLQGKIYDFTMVVSDDVSLKDAKALGEDIIKYFQEDALNYYTFQIYIMKNDEKLNNFPIIGLKSPKSSSLVWTRDRSITESESTDEKN